MVNERKDGEDTEYLLVYSNDLLKLSPTTKKTSIKLRGKQTISVNIPSQWLPTEATF